MAAHLRDNILHGRDHTDQHLDDGRWRHQESSSYARHASPRRANGVEHGSKDLADFFNKDRVEPPRSAGSTPSKSTPIMLAGNAHNGGAGAQTMGDQHDGEAGLGPVADDTHTLEVRCGPLLNYRRMEQQTWFGSVLIVTKGGGSGDNHAVPELKWSVKEHVRIATAAAAATNGHVEGVNGDTAAELSEKETRVWGTKLYSDLANTFWRFDLVVPMQQSEIRIEYKIPDLIFQSSQKKMDVQSFYVPAITESMRIMFHSCNGFSVGTDEDAWSGPVLWNDVLRVHKKTPFHVMLGGGDQIYNDGIRVNGPLRPWTDIGNPVKRREYPFPDALRRQCDDYYVNNYIRWYGTEPFASANGQIPQLNLWDDHDIIDGFGSYVDEFMRCSVFRGIGGCANKYYLLFQHHLAPPRSTYTTDAPQTTSHHSVGDDPRQLLNTYVLDEPEIDSGYIIGAKPGPYVVEHSRSIYARLGARIAFFGIDARTERTRKQVNYPETYDIIFERLRKELGAAKASSMPIQHLVVLLGIPIAYPRLTWLENIFSSPLMGPIKFLNKRFGFGGGFFNYFDGSVDLLDDLDDHYTAKTHKKERLYLVKQLQALAAEFSVRITILGGDVHLAAVGRFYSNPKLNIPISEDHRYMANVISSAIVNKPPPQAVANLLARRNKLHHLDTSTDETLMKFFDKDPGNSSKTSNSNHCTMPSRNWTMITENWNGGSQAGATNGAVTNGHATNGYATNGYATNGYATNGHATNGHATNGHATNGAIANGHAIDEATESTPPSRESAPKPKDGHSWLHDGEVNAGTTHKAAAAETHGKSTDGSLDIAIRVEKDQHDREGKTESYGMTIPLLVYTDAADHVMRKRDNIAGAFHQGHQ